MYELFRVVVVVVHLVLNVVFIYDVLLRQPRFEYEKLPRNHYLLLSLASLIITVSGFLSKPMITSFSPTLTVIIYGYYCLYIGYEWFVYDVDRRYDICHSEKKKNDVFHTVDGAELKIIDDK